MIKKILLIFIIFTLFPKYIYAQNNVYYKIEYYYDNIRDNTKTVERIGNVGDVIYYYPQKEKENYRILYSTIDDEGLTLDSNKNFNIIKVYYISNQFENNTKETPPKTGIQNYEINILITCFLYSLILWFKQKMIKYSKRYK